MKLLSFTHPNLFFKGIVSIASGFDSTPSINGFVVGPVTVIVGVSIVQVGADIFEFMWLARLQVNGRVTVEQIVLFQEVRAPTTVVSMPLTATKVLGWFRGEQWATELLGSDRLFYSGLRNETIHTAEIWWIFFKKYLVVFKGVAIFFCILYYVFVLNCTNGQKVKNKYFFFIHFRYFEISVKCSEI